MAVTVLIMGFLSDEATALQKYLEIPDSLDVHSEICPTDAGIGLINQLHPEMVLLNIDTIDHKAFAITKKIKEISDSIRVVFIASHTTHLVDAFELNVYDYIKKPVQVERLLKTMTRLDKELSADTLPIIPVWKSDRFVVLKPEQIIYLYTTGNKTLIKSKEGEYSSLNTLFSFEKKLNHSSFFRTHKSFLVNLDYIKEIIPWFNHTYNLVMDRYENDEVPVSRTHLKDFKKRMGID